MTNEFEDLVPHKEWFHFDEACSLKGINYHTAFNNRKLLPNGGVPDGKIGGRLCFRRKTVIAWLGLTDDDIKNNN